MNRYIWHRYLEHRQTLLSLWMRLPYDIRQTLKRILLFDYLYTVPRYTRITFNREIPFVPPCAKPIQPPQHANYHKIQSFPFPNTKSEQKEVFLFYDIFARNNELFILFIKEDHETLAISTKDIHITVDQQALPLKETIVGHGYTYILIYAFDYPFTEHQVRVSCKGISKDFVISHAHLKHTGLLLHSTLFKDDHFLLPMAYDYYTKQGADSFVWYYNGVFDQTLRYKYSFGDNVIIIDWPYPYIAYGVCAAAQFTQQLHTLYKYGKPSYEYVGFLDLDEYVKTDCANLRSYILQNPGYLSYVFLSCWAWVLRLRTTSSKRWQHLPRVLLRAKVPTYKTWPPFYIKHTDSHSEKYHYFSRSKGVYRTDLKAIFVHCCLATCSDDTAQERSFLIKPSSILLHFTNLRIATSRSHMRTFTDYLRREDKS